MPPCYGRAPVVMKTLRVLILVLAVLPLHACANSILGNAATAGIETLENAPEPTPTATSGRAR